MNHAIQPLPNSLARFRKEFAALYGGDPFPWQERLFLEFCAGEIPSALDLPTGLGKTSVMPIWLMARALAPDAARKKIPRRLVYIVDRRVVVDQATTEAEKLREWLEKSGMDLKSALNLTRSSRAKSGTTLPISTLRGQLADNREWQEHPAACAIVVGTVDMIGSRILFSGYGVSPKMRPYHAGFLGADTLVVLDEAHLIPPFEALLRTIECDPHGEFRPKFGEHREIVPEFRLMCLSATGARRPEPDRVFALGDEDYAHDIVRERLRAPKHLTIDEEATNDALAERLASRAWTLATEPAPARVLVYCDRREDALKVVEQLEKRAGRRIVPAIGLLVGERRVREREDLYDWLRDNCFIGPAPAAPDSPTFLVATSAGEVGVDLDADHIVCDLVEWERMVQRFGRVNRRGRKQSRIEVIPASAKDKKKGAEDWEKRLPQLLAPLSELPVLEGSRDASPGAIAEFRAKSDLQDLLQKAESRKPLYPALTRALIEAWAMTSIEQHSGRPDIQPWLRGWEEDDEPQSTIVWRRFLPPRDRERPERSKDINDFFEAAPVQLTEMLETETWRAVDWLVARAVAKVSAARRSKHGEGQKVSAEDALFVLDGKGRCENSYSMATLAELERKENRKDREDFGKAIVGRMLVVPSRFGGLDSKGVLSHQEDEEASTIDNDANWAETAGFRVGEITQVSPVKDAKWREFYRLVTERVDDGTEIRWIVVEEPRAQGQTEEALGVARNEQSLEEHQQQAAAAARKLAQALELPAPYDEMFALAAKLHDEGKRARRWQRAFNAPTKEAFAKTKGPVNLRLLDGYRHEFGSLLRVNENPKLDALPSEVRNLALHLIAAHHGNARPLISARSCEDGPPSVLEEKAGEVALRFAWLQKRWGLWGLAWWEALLRSVDQQVSRDNDAREERAIDSVNVEETV